MTGASNPIGKAICEDLVKHGLIVCGLATRAGKHELEVSVCFKNSSKKLNYLNN